MTPYCIHALVAIDMKLQVCTKLVTNELFIIDSF